MLAAVFASSRADALLYGPSQSVLRLEPTAGIMTYATADFNGDGLLDLVVARSHFQSPEVFPVTIVLNNGAGGYFDGTPSIFEGLPPVVQHPRRIVIADFNGDGRPDVFVADHGNDSPPYSGFQNKLVLSTPQGRLRDATQNLPQQSDFSHSAAASDVDGDGDIDLVIGNLFGGTAIPPQVWLNDGTGQFTVLAEALPTHVTRLSPYNYATVYLVDVNNDGHPDLVLGGNVASNGDATPSIILLNDGHGHFLVEEAGAMPAKPFAPTAIAIDIQSTDLNHDGFVDLIVAFTKAAPAYRGRWIQILINNGDGTFRDETEQRLPGQSDNTDEWIMFLRLVDLDGDGHLDLLTQLHPAVRESPAMYRNDGNGRFTRFDPFVIVPQNVYAVVDADGDGGLDFLMGTSPSIFATPPFSLPEEYFLLRDHTPRAAITFNSSRLSPGQTLRLELRAQNPGGNAPADLYVGAVWPDGRSVAFFSGPATVGGIVDIATQPLSTVQRMAGASPGFSVSFKPMFEFTLPASGLPFGDYLVFALLLVPGALDDGSLDAKDIQAFSTKIFTLAP
jgi:hypothetical protein